jgi:ethanolaminephosphotransferase
MQDFTEVDNNVTRHVPEELGRDDWDSMIMHYLGLDHIGHKTGPQGPNMIPKQHEMDEIVKTIFKAMEKNEHHAKTLLVLAGDHGMNAGGNHGGSGPGETEPALLFASPQLRKMRRESGRDCPTAPKPGTEFHYYTKVQQSDLIPTLAGLMGFPVSLNSLGVFIPDFVALWPDEDSTRLLRQNARQILRIVEALHGTDTFQAAVSTYQSDLASYVGRNKPCESTDEGLERLACLWAVASTFKGAQASLATEKAALYAFMNEAQETLSGTASSYNIPRMVAGIVLSTVILSLALFSFPSLRPISVPGIFLATIGILYGIMMFASSYVEEEQHFWYWLTPAWIVILAASGSGLLHAPPKRRVGIAAATFVLLATHRFAVRWNQTGQKHAGAPDIVHTFFPHAVVLLWVLVLAAYAHVGVQLVRRSTAGLLPGELGAVLAAATVAVAVVFKLNFTQADAPELVQDLAEQIRAFTQQYTLVLQARVAFALIGALVIAVTTLSIASARANSKAVGQSISKAGSLPSLAERLHYLLTLFLMMQTRAANIPLFLGLELQMQAIRYLLLRSRSSGARHHSTRIAVTTLLLSHVYFFCMGGSNSISSIDLSNAYNGVADYNIGAVGVLLFASNWTAAIWWCSATVLLLVRGTRPAFVAQKSSEPEPASRAWVDDERKKLHQDALRAAKNGVGTSAAFTLDGASIWMSYLSCSTAFVAVSLVAVMAACTALRTHLFIWTVFSPKYLYSMAWSIGWHIIVNIGLGSVLTQAAKIV